MVYSALARSMDAWRVQTAAAFCECFCIVTVVLSYDHAWNTSIIYYIDSIQDKAALETAALDGVCDNPGFCGVLYIASDRYGRFYTDPSCVTGNSGGDTDSCDGNCLLRPVSRLYQKNRYILVGLFVAVASVVVESLAVYFVVSISGIFIELECWCCFCKSGQNHQSVRDLERKQQE